MVRVRVSAEPLCAVTWHLLLNSVRNTATAMLSIRCVHNSNNTICFPEDELSFAKITETKIFRNLSADNLSKSISVATAFSRLLLGDHDVSLGNRKAPPQKDWSRTTLQATRGATKRNFLTCVSASPLGTNQPVFSHFLGKLGCSGGL